MVANEEIVIKETEGIRKGILWKLTAEVLAQSAFNNDITLEEFKLSLDIFSNKSVSSVEQIYKWREAATEIFFDLLEKTGRLSLKPAEFLGGSDYEEVNGTATDNENKNNFKENTNNGKHES